MLCLTLSDKVTNRVANGVQHNKHTEFLAPFNFRLNKDNDDKRIVD